MQTLVCVHLNLLEIEAKIFRYEIDVVSKENVIFYQIKFPRWKFKPKLFKNHIKF